MKKIYGEHFKHRMRRRPIMKKFREYDKEVEDEYKHALKVSKENVMPDLSEKDLDLVLKKLKKSLSADSQGMVNELFMLEILEEI